MEVRQAHAQELEGLPDLEARADELFASVGFGPLPPPGTPEELAAALVVLVAGRPPAGFVRLEELGGCVHLEQLSVDPDHMRQGVGTVLIRAALEWARQAGYREMTLATYRDVAWNAPFYAAQGFVESGAVDDWYAQCGVPPEEPVMSSYGTRVLMRQTL